MPASDGPDGDDPEAAAARYAAELAARARPGSAVVPHFDVVLLGIGEDGHVASIFPEHPVGDETRPVVGGPRQPEAAADPDHADAADAQHRRRGVDHRVRRRARREAVGLALGGADRTCRCRRPACTASSARCGCSTATPRREVPHS